ncbi:hypothetical protein, partial [Streptomyces sp. NPDC059278]|uniref:hypothetical protein n=1 Tax=Streptomyces sp. NPDC059278 TaxID=3346801 RepID=UPI00367DE5B9
MDHMPYNRPGEVVLLQRSRYLPLAPRPASNEHDWLLRCELCGQEVTTTILSLFRQAKAQRLVVRPRNTCDHSAYRPPRAVRARRPSKFDDEEYRARILAEAGYELVGDFEGGAQKWHVRCLLCGAEVYAQNPRSLRPRTRCRHSVDMIIVPARDRLERHPG